MSALPCRVDKHPSGGWTRISGWWHFVGVWCARRERAVQAKHCGGGRRGECGLAFGSLGAAVTRCRSCRKWRVLHFHGLPVKSAWRVSGVSGVTSEVCGGGGGQRTRRLLPRCRHEHSLTPGRQRLLRGIPGGLP